MARVGELHHETTLLDESVLVRDGELRLATRLESNSIVHEVTWMMGGRMRDNVGEVDRRTDSHKKASHSQPASQA